MKPVHASFWVSFIDIVVSVFNILFRPFVMLKLYGWFILPVFTSMPVLGLIQMLGVCFFYGFLNIDLSEIKKAFDKQEEAYDKPKPTPEEKFGKNLKDLFISLAHTLLYVLVLFGGWFWSFVL